MKSRVKSKYELTEVFRFKKGVMQGCLLSPFLFALFFNDLETDLKEGRAKGVDFWDIQICSLLYADDLVLIATDENDLKLQMDLLGKYAAKYNMEVNPKKTKVITYNDKSWKPADCLFGKIESVKMYTIDQYKYLGVIFDNKMSFKSHINMIAEKVDKCLWALI